MRHQGRESQGDPRESLNDVHGESIREPSRGGLSLSNASAGSGSPFSIYMQQSPGYNRAQPSDFATKPPRARRGKRLAVRRTQGEPHGSVEGSTSPSHRRGHPRILQARLPTHARRDLPDCLFIGAASDIYRGLAEMLDDIGNIRNVPTFSMRNQKFELVDTQCPRSGNCFRRIQYGIRFRVRHDHRGSPTHHRLASKKRFFLGDVLRAQLQRMERARRWGRYSPPSSASRRSGI